MKPARLAYEGVAVAVPVTVPYARYSNQSSHHFAITFSSHLFDDEGEQGVSSAGVRRFCSPCKPRLLRGGG